MAVPTAKKIREYLGDNYQESDEELIQLYIETHKYYRRLKKEVEKTPLMLEHTNKSGATNTVKNPLAIEVTKTVQTLNNLLKSLGLTPAQRKKVGVAGDDDDDDFDNF
ncbi:P27 family predicted phage terminase small subunit [Aneurinibacillus soli]|uniref:Phage terminase, small subunit n=1 Tax=Aneurinibacillus soli TaxID=1500254 RepID=A0A0U5BBP3_9BACL|nr:phage terminase small subunit P27 family [Aneurinibacillus soli]PYE63445.1 P27 family predicted phage terminase small subunit [Aneurinibacillus soli]BAU27623.1 Phage terminase, small subunit [Aneurinibacillus soli]